METKMEMKNFNSNTCHASKNQKGGKYVQCPYEIKSNNYCGRHKNYRYETYKELFKKRYREYDKKGNEINDIFNDTDSDINTESSESDGKCKDNQTKNNIISTKLIGSLDVNGTKSIKKKLKLSLKNNEIIDRMLINRNIFLDAQKDDKFITILDYYFDPTFKEFTNTKIQNTFKHYKLEYKRDELIELIRLNRNKTEANKILIKNKKNEYAKSRLISLFDTIFKANLNMDKVFIIQRNVKNFLIRKNIKTRGIAIYNRTLCVNDTDFNTLDPLDEISNHEFYSYVDNRKFVYGFHIDSIHELFKRKRGKVKNPYTRDYFPDKTRKDVTELKNKMKNESQDNQQRISLEVLVRFKCLDVFGKIDIHGYHTNINWLYNVSSVVLKIFYKKLLQYWNHRFGMTRSIKNKILPGGDVINSNANIVRSSLNKHKLLDKILDILDLVVSSAEDNNDKNLGSILVLHALSEISTECIETNPWLQ